MTAESDDRKDAITHAAWELQNEQDPHRILVTTTDRLARNLRPLNDQQRKQYADWHRSRRHAALAAAQSLDYHREAVGLPRLERPTLSAAIAHHTRMIDAIKATYPPPKAPKKNRPKLADPKVDSAAEIARYARTQGITVRQAAEVLARMNNRKTKR